MRDEKRINRILNLIKKIWLKYQDLRLMQLLGNCFVPGDNYHKEDTELEGMLKQIYKEK